MVKLLERVNKITPTKLGNIATDLKRMQTIDDKFISLHQVDADYTILVFYEPHCGHCKKEVPVLMQQFRDSLKTMNVKVFALYTQYDKEEWKTFLDEKTCTKKVGITCGTDHIPTPVLEIFTTITALLLFTFSIVIKKLLENVSEWKVLKAL
jgi:thiol-disulfide isomerase/thioredoxin